jgi:hypothetical protein
MDSLIEFGKNTLISVVSQIIFTTKKSPPTMKRAIHRKKEPKEPK